MKIKTSELIGAQLDWAVAKATNAQNLHVTDRGSVCCIYELQCGSGCWTGYYEPSTDWGQGGPLIEKFRPAIVYHNGPDETPMAATREQSPNFMAGDTVLIAAMRAIVASVYGEEIEVPEELV